MSRMNPDTDFPTKLKYLRFYYDLSQAYIADSLNVNRLSYMAYENGNVQPPIEMLAAIASFFAVSTDSLLGLAPLEVASDTHAFYPRQVQDAPVCLFRYVLQLCRTRRHLTQLQLCGMLGLDTGAYTAYEIGEKEPEFKILVQLSRFFGVSVDYLLGAAPDEELKKAIEPFLGTYAFPSGRHPVSRRRKRRQPGSRRQDGYIPPAHKSADELSSLPAGNGEGTAPAAFPVHPLRAFPPRAVSAPIPEGDGHRLSVWDQRRSSSGVVPTAHTGKTAVPQGGAEIRVGGAYPERQAEQPLHTEIRGCMLNESVHLRLL